MVLDARTGEVLAMANYPSYNPNQREGLSGAQLRNRAITDTYEPGSTMKPFTIAVGLETGKITPETPIQTGNGKLQFGKHVISDTHANGLLTVNGVLQKSSNIGMTKISQMLPAKDMWEEFTQVGLGQAPRVGFPGAVAGRLLPAAKWRPIEQATMSYGYGLSVSLIQMARAYTVFVNDGQVLPLSFTKLHQAPEGARVIGYSIAGKTGTARKQSNGGYLERKYIGSFIGFAPASNPRIIVAVMVDEPSAGKIYGGDVAAPVFAAVVSGALRALNVPPDAPYKTLVVRDQGIAETVGQSLDEGPL